jgi:hypothetical protein
MGKFPTEHFGELAGASAKKSDKTCISPANPDNCRRLLIPGRAVKTLELQRFMNLPRDGKSYG